MQTFPADRPAIAPGRKHQKSTVCQLLHTLHVGGAEVLAARLGRQLRCDYRFLFVCLDEVGTIGEELRQEGFTVEVLERRRGVDWRCAMRLAKIFQREQVSLVHAHQYTPFFYGLLARFFYRKPPVLFTEHGRHFPDYPRPKRKIANRVLLERRDRVIGVGKAVRQALIANEGFPAQRVGVIYNGIDASHFANDDLDREAIRRGLGIHHNEFVILQVARLDYLKDHATAVRAMRRVIAIRPESRLWLVGDGPERDAIQQIVDANQLGNYVRFLGLRKDIDRLLRAADLFLLSSISEGIPLTIIEAMAAGLPVVATRVGGIGEIVYEGETALLAPSKNDAVLADHILRLLPDGDRRLHMGQRGRERATALFAETSMHKSYVRLYREMLHG